MEIEKLFCLYTRRIPRVEWIEAYITARSRAFIPRSIESSFRAYGIYLLSPITILSTLRVPTPTTPVIPPPITTLNDLDRSLLNSLPPEGTELREAMSLVNSFVRSFVYSRDSRKVVYRASGSSFRKDDLRGCSSTKRTFRS